MLRPCFARDNQVHIVTGGVVPRSDFTSGDARFMQPSNLLGFLWIQLEVTSHTAVRHLVKRLQVLNIDTRRIVAQMVQMYTRGQLTISTLVKVAVCQLSLAIAEDLSVATLQASFGYDMTRRVVATVEDEYGPRLSCTGGVTPVDIAHGASFYHLVFSICPLGYVGLFSAPAPAEAVGNIRALRQPIVAVFGGCSGYSFDVATSSYLGSGRAPGRSNVAGAFPISKPNYTIGAAA